MYGQNERKATFFAKTKTNQGASAAARVQGGTRFSRGQKRTKRKEEKVLSWKTVKFVYPINSFKENGFSRKTSASFRLLKIYKSITSSQRVVSA